MFYKLEKRHNQFTEKTTHILKKTKIWNFEDKLDKEIKYLNIQENKNLVNINISSQNLEGLKIQDNMLLKNIKLNCPNLKNIIIRGNRLKKFSFIHPKHFLKKLVIDEDLLEKFELKVDILEKLRLYTDDGYLMNPIIEISNDQTVDIRELPLNVLFSSKSKTYELFLDHKTNPKLIQNSEIFKKLF